MRGTVGILILIGVLLVAPSSALAATQRYASPTGSGTACTSSAPCSIVTAINNAGAGAQVIVAGNEGTYGTASSPLTTELVMNAAFSVSGAAGQPRPVIYSNASSGVTSIGLDVSSGDTVSDLDLEFSGTSFGLYADGTSASPASIDHVIVRAGHAFGGGACSLFAATMIDSLCQATGSGGGSDALLENTSFGTSQGTLPVTLRNDTLEGGSNFYGLAADPGNSHLSLAITVSNTIIHGVTDIWTSTSSGGSVTITLDHSNYATVDHSGGGTITAPGSGSNQTAAPKFVSASTGDYHEAAGSPTIDAGITSSANGSTDLDGNPRTLGASTDIGAYEYVPPVTPPAPKAPVISGLKLNHSRFKLGRRHKRPKVSFSDSEAGTVTFSVYRFKHGKRGKLVGTFTESAVAGADGFKFSGRVKGKKLKKGKYELVAVPASDGLTGASVSVKFKVK